MNGFRTLGVSVGKSPGVPLREAIKLAQEAEAAGFGIVSAGEGAIENFSMLGALAMATERVELFSGIASWTRTPVTTATGALTLADLSARRYRLGLGPMPRAWSEGWHDVDYSRPVDRMRDYIAAIRAGWSARPGHPVDHRGPYYTVSGFEPLVDLAAPVPLYLAVTRRGMARLGGEVADGVILNAMTSLEWVRDVLLDEVRTGLGRSGRDVAAMDVGLLRICEIDEDPERAREVARRSLAFYFRVPYLREQLEYIGLGAEAERGYAACAAGDVAGMTSAVSDAMLDRITLTGRPEDVREGLRRYAGLVDWVLLVSDLAHIAPDPLQPGRRIISTFASA